MVERLLERLGLHAGEESDRAPRWDGMDEEALQERIRLATRTGRPFGSEAFTDDLERWLERSVRPGVVGRHGETRDLIVQHTLHPG